MTSSTQHKFYDYGATKSGWIKPVYIKAYFLCLHSKSVFIQSNPIATLLKIWVFDVYQIVSKTGIYNGHCNPSRDLVAYSCSYVFLRIDGNQRFFFYK